MILPVVELTQTSPHTRSSPRTRRQLVSLVMPFRRGEAERTAEGIV